MDQNDRALLLAAVRSFVAREIAPVAARLERDDAYPHEIVRGLKELGLFGALVRPEYGGLGLDVLTYSEIVEEICKAWMSVSGILNTHLIMAWMIQELGTEEQRRQFLPRMASGELRGGLGLTEPHAGSDLQAIRTVARRDGEDFVVEGSKTWITNGGEGDGLALLVKTDPDARPAHAGMSVLLVEKGPGLRVGRKLGKLGYRGVDTVELFFEGLRVPAGNLLGGTPGRGFQQTMSGLELGRINIAARAVGVAQAALDHAIAYARERHAFGKPIADHQAIQLKLADMATRIAAARLLTRDAAEKKDRGERADLEAGMAKLFASEMCHEVTLDAMRILGANGYSTDYPLERFYRDAPLMIIGEGTNDIQRLVIARRLLGQSI